jgi:hypothetical protein
MQAASCLKTILTPIFPLLQEHDALSFIFMQNVGVRFGKVIIANWYTCSWKVSYSLHFCGFYGQINCYKNSVKV